MLLAGITWLPLLAGPLTSRFADERLLSCALIALTVLPLAAWRRPWFRGACWTVSGLMFGALLLTGPYVVFVAPAFAVCCPAAVLLLIAGKRDLGRIAPVIACVHGSVPFVIYLATGHPFAAGWS
ncbi:hypothetical protein ACPC54_41300 [Kitasatospora sp. NPDC094028]